MSTTQYAFPSFLKLCHRLGEGLFTFEPEVLKGCIVDHDRQLEQALCVANFVTTDSAYTDSHIFNHTVCVFNDRPADFYHMAEITVSEICWALHQMRSIDPVGLFTNEVLAYIAVILHEEGFVIPPPELQKETSIEGLPFIYFLDQLTGLSLGHKPLDVEQSVVQHIKLDLVKGYITAHSEDLSTHMHELQRELA